jgi:hypothetical protein
MNFTVWMNIKCINLVLIIKISMDYLLSRIDYGLNQSTIKIWNYKKSCTLNRLYSYCLFIERWFLTQIPNPREQLSKLFQWKSIRNAGYQNIWYYWRVRGLVHANAWTSMLLQPTGNYRPPLVFEYTGTVAICRQ